MKPLVKFIAVTLALMALAFGIAYDLKMREPIKESFAAGVYHAHDAYCAKHPAKWCY